MLVLGATSGIAREIALELARRGHPLCLAGRDREELERIGADIRIRTGVSTWALPFDADDCDSHQEAFDAAVSVAGAFEGVVLAFGYLGDQERAEKYWSETRAILSRNFLAAASVLHVVARYMEGRKSGWIVALSSVAGDRGRMSNYVYGSAKGGLTVFLQGLRSRLQKSDVHVLTVKPGPVDTAMTFGMPKLPLLAQPGPVAKAIVRALERRKDVLYVPGPWALVMAVLKAVPEGIFKKTKL
ncbi:MAG: SDR family oxidoreductase [Fimbriimonadaceae bacterium]|nr:SDR family oxidoreductase [Fimbriimonadaceae bacterium]QYK56605.1 MAG: SDR family oxidoreductase [Fimbriimonadaceae bacterium]